MEYRGIEYTVVQGIERGVWKWSAPVTGARIFGQESIRSAAVAAAENAIDRRYHKQAGARSINDPRADERNNLRLALATFALQLDAFEARLKTQRAQ
jgi:hypothetical protein